MTYRLEFKTSAQKEWQKLDSQIREQFKKKLIERLAQPRIESARLAGRIRRALTASGK
jgi:mRNA interferase RelE/StbE